MSKLRYILLLQMLDYVQSIDCIHITISSLSQIPLPSPNILELFEMVPSMHMKVERIAKRPEADIRIVVILKEKTPGKIKEHSILQKQEKKKPLGLDLLDHPHL